MLAHESGARPVVLLNKADLRGDLEDVVRLTERRAPGVPVLALSALRNWGLDSIRGQIGVGGDGGFDWVVGCWEVGDCEFAAGGDAATDFGGAGVG